VPRAIATSSYYYPLQRIEEVGTWAASIARRLPKEVELTIYCTPSPPGLADRCRSSNGLVCNLRALAFFDTAREAIATLDVLDSCPVSDECLEKELHQFTTLDALIERGGVRWPEGHRYLVDTLWSNSPPLYLLAPLRNCLMRAPSPKSLAVVVFPTSADIRDAPMPDAAFSMTAGMLVLCYAIWERPEDDAGNATWHRETMSALDSFATGHYVGEADIVADPARAERSFAKENWQRLQSLRLKYDPDDLFHGHFSAR
jgi:FAD/FMN-containing dehydrogenase